MCLAVYSPKNIDLISEQTICEAWESNPHGAGIAINYGHKIVVMKGFMELDTLLMYVESHREILKKNEVVIHFRWTTSGGTSPEMTHPFPITKHNELLKQCYFETTEKVLIHNGVLFNPMIDDYSDTAIFASWLARFNPSLERIKKESQGNRLAIVSTDGVTLTGDWILEDDNCLYSNNYWRTKGSPIDDYWFDFEDFCPGCGSFNTEFIGANTSTHECLDCGTVFNEQFSMEPCESDYDYILGYQENKKSKKKKESDFLDDDYNDVLEYIDGTTLKKVRA